MFIGPIAFLDLVTVARAFPSQHPNIRATPEAVQFYLAATVLRSIMGDAWCDKNLVASEKSDPHLIPIRGETASAMRIQARIVALGEMLFNLQPIVNSSDRFRRLRSIALEAAIAELEAARLLALSDIEFSFVREEWHTRENGGLIRLAKFREIVNEHSRFRRDDIVHQLKLRVATPLWIPKRWKTFLEACERIQTAGTQN
jgi:hypothetical protein